MLRTIAILEVMWDWRAQTSKAGYQEKAPPWFRINPENFTGKRLYNFVGKANKDGLKVTNACPQLVESAKGRGKPDEHWLRENLEKLRPFDLVLVCGKVAQSVFCLSTVVNARGIEKGKSKGHARVIFMPHPAARNWTTVAMSKAAAHIQEGTGSYQFIIRDGKLQVKGMSY